ncbi:MAG: 1-deoxy-D-xylulose-5-phosphate reductoisomerase, partial [Planctomycetota bacterium]
DGSVIAQLSPPDMKSPIQYALTWPDRAEGCSPKMDWSNTLQLDFEPVDHQRFPALGLAYRVVEAGGSAGAVFNAANEVAVAAYLQRRIPFGRISQLVGETLDIIEPAPIESLDDVHRADNAARQQVGRLIAETPLRREPQTIKTT